MMLFIKCSFIMMLVVGSTCLAQEVPHPLPASKEKEAGIIFAGDPRLRHKSAPVEDPLAPETKAIVQKLKAAAQKLGANDVAGLAAPQLGINKRIFIYSLPDIEKLKRGEVEKPEDIVFYEAINPEITPIGEEKEYLWDGCFSLPHIVFKIPRYKKVHYRYQDLQGHWHEGDMQGYPSFILQHEADHLEGRLEIDHLDNPQNFAYLEELEKIALAMKAQMEKAPIEAPLPS